MLATPSPIRFAPIPTPVPKRHLRLIPREIPDLTDLARLMPPEIVDLTAFAIVCPPEIEDMSEHAKLLTPPAIPVALRASTPDVAKAMIEVYALGELKAA